MNAKLKAYDHGTIDAAETASEGGFAVLVGKINCVVVSPQQTPMDGVVETLLHRLNAYEAKRTP